MRHLKSVPSHNVVMTGLVVCKRRRIIAIYPDAIKRAVGSPYAGLTTLQVVEAVWQAVLDSKAADDSYRVIIDPVDPDGDPPCGCLSWETYAYEEVAA